jgi:tRNA dimethylallyltransferase
LRHKWVGVSKDQTRTVGEADTRPPVVVVTGPTASGKSGLALALARAFDGVIVNSDAMQVYRELAVLTARPSAEDMALAPHRLYGVLPGATACSAGRWRGQALAEIAAAQKAGRLPLVVGGTGLYVRALVRGLTELPAIPAALRQAARERHRAIGGPALHAELARRDPATAGRLRPGDTQRLIRAWEVLEATGRSLAEWQAADGGEAAPYRFLCIALMPPRGTLHAACDGRFLRMLEAGALDEVRALLALGLDPGLPVMKALGVPELAAHLHGALPLKAAVRQAQQATRRYAKRQTTWLRTQMPRDFSGNQVSLVVIKAQYSESLQGEIFTIIRDFLLTPRN